MTPATHDLPASARRVLCLTGDLMTGRGIDQLFAHASRPVLYEPAVSDAREYVTLAEARNGPIPRPVDPSYVWGDALAALALAAPDARIVNLETSVTTSDACDRGKDIHYRMHPENAALLTAAAIDVCTLANNHVLDWGRKGLEETLDTLNARGLAVSGAGRTRREAESPAVVPLARGGRLLVFAVGSSDSGIAEGWAAGDHRSGVDLLPDLSADTARALCRRVAASRQPGDTAVVSIHWGSNWGYAVPGAHVRFAHALVDGGVDLVHGHSSHHPRPVEVYRERLILYGCGDLLNDYEGIQGHEAFRGDLSLLYFATLDAATGSIVRLCMTPMQILHMRLMRATEDDAEWMRDSMDVISAPFGVRVARDEEGDLTSRWS